MQFELRYPRCVKLLVAALLVVPLAAAAEPGQVQVDGGLSVIGPGYEHPVTSNISIGVETFVFGTYFLPWFDLGDDVKGFGAGLRPTWFARETRRGLYVAPYVRGVIVDDESIVGASGLGIAGGFFVGWAFGLTDRLDLRVGGGVQYIHAHVETDQGRESFGTPFVALDALLGYRL